MISEILQYFPENIRENLEKNIDEKTEEIRIRVGRKIIIKNLENEKMIENIITKNDILNIVQRLCDNSIYAYQNEICNRIYYNKRWT